MSQNHRKEREKLIEIIGGSQCKNGKVKGLVNINRINLIKDQKKKRKKIEVLPPFAFGDWGGTGRKRRYDQLTNTR